MSVCTNQQYTIHHILHCTDVRSEGWNRSPLYYACGKGHKQVVQYLVEGAHCDVSEYHDTHCVNCVHSLGRGLSVSVHCFLQVYKMTTDSHHWTVHWRGCITIKTMLTLFTIS